MALSLRQKLVRTLPTKVNNTRAMLLALGLGDYSATLIIRYMMKAPATTDPDMPSIVQLTRAIQENLNKLNAQLEVTGILDAPTADVIKYLTGGNGFLQRPWYEVVQAVLNAKSRGMDLTPNEEGIDFAQHAPLSGVGGSLDFLPSVPGGMVTYGIGAAALCWFLFKKKR